MITIIIPTFNAAAYIAQTIESVIKQTYTNWKMIVVDDHSTDGTCEIIARYIAQDARIDLIRLAENFGRPARPRNIGLQNTQTPWIAFLDADDIWHPEKLAIQLKAAQQDNFDLLCTGMVDFTGIAPPPAGIDRSNTKHIHLSSFTLFSKNRIPTSSVIAKTESIRKMGGFNESADYKAIEDYDLWLRMSVNNMHLGKVAHPLVQYRILANSISRNKKQHAKKVAWLVYTQLKENKPGWIFLYPYFICSYVTMSFYYRVIKKTL